MMRYEQQDLCEVFCFGWTKHSCRHTTDQERPPLRVNALAAYKHAQYLECKMAVQIMPFEMAFKIIPVKRL